MFASVIYCILYSKTLKHELVIAHICIQVVFSFKGKVCVHFHVNMFIRMHIQDQAAAVMFKTV